MREEIDVEKVKQLRIVVGALALGILVLILAGCGSIREVAQNAIDVATGVRNEATPVLEELEREARRLPEGDPVRVALEDKIENIRRVLEDADEIIATSQKVINALDTGDLDSSTRDALSRLPYGAYIAGALGLALALQRHFRASKLNEHLRRVVQSWQDVGDELSPEEKRQVAEIQGAETTAEVHRIKTDLVAR